MALEITRLNGYFGAEVSGVDMADIDDSTRDELRDLIGEVIEVLKSSAISSRWSISASAQAASSSSETATGV